MLSKVFQSRFVIASTHFVQAVDLVGLESRPRLLEDLAETSSAFGLELGLGGSPPESSVWTLVVAGGLGHVDALGF